MSHLSDNGTIIYPDVYHNGAKIIFEKLRPMSTDKVESLLKFHLYLMDRKVKWEEEKFNQLYKGFDWNRSLSLTNVCEAEIQSRNDKKNGQGFIRRMFSKLLW